MRNQFNGEPLTDPVEMHVFFYFKIPASYHKHKDEMIGTPLAHKPDLSNLVKFVEDAANGVLYKDDSCIVHIEAWKLYGEEEMTEITLFEWQK